MGNNSGDKGKKYGHAGTKRGRFNANPTPCNHISCNILSRAKQEKVAALKAPRIVKTFVSKAMSLFSTERT